MAKGRASEVGEGVSQVLEVSLDELSHRDTHVAPGRAAPSALSSLATRSLPRSPPSSGPGSLAFPGWRRGGVRP